MVGAQARGGPLSDCPEQWLEAGLQHVWSTTGHQLCGNVLTLVHHAKRRR